MLLWIKFLLTFQIRIVNISLNHVVHFWNYFCYMHQFFCKLWMTAVETFLRTVLFYLCFSLYIKEIVLLLLRYDACANIINGTAQIPKDVTEDDEIITMLEGMEWCEYSLMASHYGGALSWDGDCLCSCREEGDEAARGEAPGSSQRGRRLQSV